MHPYPHLLFHRGPSRFLWFLFGAGAATWWHHASLTRDQRAQYFPCLTHHRRVQDPHGSTRDPSPDRHAAVWSHERDWEQDRERLRHLQQRAGETVVDLSESTLESIISGAESLKAKLAQLRAERERLEAEKKADQPAA